jgi:hypothetical protein
MRNDHANNAVTSDEIIKIIYPISRNPFIKTSVLPHRSAINTSRDEKIHNHIDLHIKSLFSSVTDVRSFR